MIWVGRSTGLQALRGQESQDFIAARLRADEVRMLLDVFDQAVLILAHLEEIVVLADAFDWPFAVRAEAVRRHLFRSKTARQTCNTIQYNQPCRSAAYQKVLEDIVERLICVVHPSS